MRVCQSVFLLSILQTCVSMSHVSVADSAHEPDKVLIYWSPEGCSNEKVLDEGMVAIMSASTHVSLNV